MKKNHLGLTAEHRTSNAQSRLVGTSRTQRPTWNRKPALGGRSLEGESRGRGRGREGGGGRGRGGERGREGEQYCLRKDLGYWRLRFAGREALFKHEQGATYVAYLLLNPPEEPIHALELCGRVNGLERKFSGIADLVDPTSGEVKRLEAGARLQERGLALEDAETMRAVLRTQEQLEALLEDEDRTEPEKREAQRELIALYDYEKQHSHKVRDNAGRAADAVGRAIKRFYAHLAGAVDGSGGPHPVLGAFAEHIREHVLAASGRGGGAGGARRRGGLGGCFMYERPSGVVWRA